MKVGSFLYCFIGDKNASILWEILWRIYEYRYFHCLKFRVWIKKNTFPQVFLLAFRLMFVNPLILLYIYLLLFCIMTRDNDLILFCNTPFGFFSEEKKQNHSLLKMRKSFTSTWIKCSSLVLLNNEPWRPKSIQKTKPWKSMAASILGIKTKKENKDSHRTIETA